MEGQPESGSAAADYELQLFQWASVQTTNAVAVNRHRGGRKSLAAVFQRPGVELTASVAVTTAFPLSRGTHILVATSALHNATGEILSAMYTDTSALLLCLGSRHRALQWYPDSTKRITSMALADDGCVLAATTADGCVQLIAAYELLMDRSQVLFKDSTTATGLPSLVSFARNKMQSRASSAPRGSADSAAAAGSDASTEGGCAITVPVLSTLPPLLPPGAAASGSVGAKDRDDGGASAAGAGAGGASSTAATGSSAGSHDSEGDELTCCVWWRPAAGVLAEEHDRACRGAAAAAQRQRDRSRAARARRIQQQQQQQEAGSSGGGTSARRRNHDARRRPTDDAPTSEHQQPGASAGESAPRRPVSSRRGARSPALSPSPPLSPTPAVPRASGTGPDEEGNLPPHQHNARLPTASDVSESSSAAAPLAAVASKALDQQQRWEGCRGRCIIVGHASGRVSVIAMSLPPLPVIKGGTGPRSRRRGPTDADNDEAEAEAGAEDADENDTTQDGASTPPVPTCRVVWSAAVEIGTPVTQLRLFADVTGLRSVGLWRYADAAVHDAALLAEAKRGTSSSSKARHSHRRSTAGSGSSGGAEILSSPRTGSDYSGEAASGGGQSSDTDDIEDSIRLPAPKEVKLPDCSLLIRTRRHFWRIILERQMAPPPPPSAAQATASGNTATSSGAGQAAKKAVSRGLSVSASINTPKSGQPEQDSTTLDSDRIVGVTGAELPAYTQTLIDVTKEAAVAAAISSATTAASGSFFGAKPERPSFEAAFEAALSAGKGPVIAFASMPDQVSSSSRKLRPHAPPLGGTPTAPTAAQGSSWNLLAVLGLAPAASPPAPATTGAAESAAASKAPDRAAVLLTALPAGFQPRRLDQTPRRNDVSAQVSARGSVVAVYSVTDDRYRHVVCL
jgi:hypothetical protein